MIRSRKMQLLKAMGLATILAFYIFLLVPLTLYVGNIDEFAISFPTILSHYIRPAIFLIAVFGLIGIVLTGSTYHRYIVLLATISVLLWLQGNIFVWNYGLLDGGGIDWGENPWRGWIDLTIWSVAILSAILCYSRIERPIVYMAVVTFSIQLLFSVFTGIQKAPMLVDKFEDKYSDTTLQEIFRFSPHKNVVHIILDGFQSDIFEEILKDGEEGERFVSALDGFVFFKEHMGVFPTTHMTIPAILSGKTYRNHIPRDEFIEKTIGGKTILNAAHNAGYEIDLAAPVPLFNMYTKGDYTNAYLIRTHYHATSWNYENSDSAKLFDLVLFRLAPHFLKKYIYNDQLWLVQSFLSDSDYTHLTFFAHSAFLREWVENMSADRSTPVYKLFHLMLSHNPMVTNENCKYAGQVLPTVRATVKTQAKCSLKEVVKLLERMKELDIYDDALIVLMADHGAWVPPVGQIGYILPDRKSPATINPEAIPMAALTQMATHWGSQVKYVLPDGNSMSVMNPLTVAMALPLMAIKPPGSTGSFRVSMAPSSIIDTPATIDSLLELSEEFDGASAFNLRAGEPRERRHYIYEYKKNEWKEDYLSPISEFIVRGSVFDTKAWQNGDSFLPNGVVQ